MKISLIKIVVRSARTNCIWIFALTFLLHPISSYANDDTGIKFVRNLSWEEICKRAKDEGKFIFIDFNATWCKPCREMENKVFVDNNVSRLFNERFVSVSVQVDQTKHDQQHIRNWYATAKDLVSKYSIKVLPTFIFLSPDLDLTHKASGYQNAEDFIKAAMTGLDPEQSITKQRRLFESGKLTDNDLRDFALNSLRIGTKLQADSAAHIYYNTKLIGQPETLLLDKKNLTFVQAFSKLVQSNDRVFKIVYDSSLLVDKILGVSGASKNIIEYVIYREEITPLVLNVDNNPPSIPDWKKIYDKLANSYTADLAKELVTAGQYSYYSKIKHWDEAIRYGYENLEAKKVDPTSKVGMVRINSFIWNVVLKHGTIPSHYEEGIRLMELAVQKFDNNTGLIDTYANLLYKAGYIKRAIALEKRVIEICRNAGTKEDDAEFVSFKVTLQKMMNGEHI